MSKELDNLYYQYNIANTTLVETGFEDKVSYQILFSVVGQCSDGAWEESTYMEPYWRFINVVQNPETHKVEIRVLKNNLLKSCMWNRTIWNPYLKMTDQEIRKWFAKKIKRIISMEAKDKGISLPFNSNNQFQMEYLGYSGQTVAQAVEVYKNLIKEA